MESRLVGIKDLTPADEESWRDLAARAVEPNPFFEADFLVPSSSLFDGFAQTTLVIAHDQGRFHGLMPIVCVERRRVPPRQVASTRGYPTAVAALCTPLVDPVQVDSTVDTLVHALVSAARRHDLPGIVSLDRLGDEGVVAASIRRSARRQGLPVFAKDTWLCGSISRANGWSITLNGHRRRELGRRRRHLENAVGAEVTVVDRTSDPDAVDEFLRIEASGWKGQIDNGAFVRDPAKVAWMHEWRRRWVDSGRLLVLSLQADGVSIAMQWYVWAGKRLICFRIAYDDAYAKFSPGSMLLLGALEHGRDKTDAEAIDAYTDKENRFFLDMLPERRRITMLLIGTGGWLDRGAIGALSVTSRLESGARRLRTG